MAKGDAVTAYCDMGGGEHRLFMVEADAAGRTVEVGIGSGAYRGFVEVSVVARSVGGRAGRIVRTDRFAIGRLVALTEHRVDEDLRRSKARGAARMGEPSLPGLEEER